MVKENTMKQTEIGLIPEEWEIDILENLVENERKIRYGIVQPGKFDPNGIILIRGQDYSFGWADESDFFRVTKELDEKFRNARVKCGDVLLTIVGNGTGNLAIVPDWIKLGNITQTTARIAPNNLRLNSYFIYQYLKSDSGKITIKNYVKGAAQPGLNICDVEKFKIPLPPLPEQEAIAEALSDADAWIESLEQLIAKKRLIKQGAMQELLSPASTSSATADAEPVEAWKVKKLGEVCDSIASGTSNTLNDGNIYPIQGSTGIIGFKNYFDYEGENLTVARVGAMQDMSELFQANIVCLIILYW